MIKDANERAKALQQRMNHLESMASAQIQSQSLKEQQKKIGNILEIEMDNIKSLTAAINEYDLKEQSLTLQNT